MGLCHSVLTTTWLYHNKVYDLIRVGEKGSSPMSLCHPKVESCYNRIYGIGWLR